MTIIKDIKEFRGWIFFDGECPFCRGLVRRFGPLLRHHGFGLMPLQTPWVRERLGLRPEELLNEMRVLTAEGKTFGGADAVIELARGIWWAWPLYAFAPLPGINRVLQLVYRWIARHRHCVGGFCRTGLKHLCDCHE